MEMKKVDKEKKKIDWGKIIYPAMLKAGIKTGKQLADEINRISLEELGKKITTPASASRWLRSPEKGGSEPKGTALMFLIKALKADYILMDESERPESRKSIERIAREIVKAEAEKILKQDKKTSDNVVAEFLESKNIPVEDKESILRQIKNLLKLYKEKNE
jgi:hypothetical protein